MLHPVILCGGSGTRLWPLSRECHPKQFVDLGNGRTLFKDTIRRASRLSGAQPPIVVCNEAHRFLVGASLFECGSSGALLLEPTPRNTAPAIALAALAALENASSDRDADPLLLVLPSDHLLDDEARFAEAVADAAALAREDRLVTFGIAPTAPETGFGYIQLGESLSHRGFQVARFVEKPSLERAQAMLDAGGHVWNSGMFLFRAALYLRELERHAPAMVAACRAAWNARQIDGRFTRPDAEAFAASPADSIDYALMERTALAAVRPLDARWSDLGSWEAFFRTGARDESGNVCAGDVLGEDVHGCYLHGTHRLVAAIGVSDLAVVETKDAVLVSPLDRVQDIKQLVARLQKDGRPEAKFNSVVDRPWGQYESLISGPRFQVKRIVVNPGAMLSLQMHYHRAEHWVVVQGTAEVTNGDSVRLFTEDQSTYIPLGTMHRLRNPGTVPLVIIEIQSGSYLGEDDIVRVEDVYGRKEK